MLNLKQLHQFLSTELDNYVIKNDYPTLYEPIDYILKLPSKRLRPLLVLVSTQMCGGNLKNALMPAIGTEMFHNFSLIHDDIMDKADMRRGQQSVHNKWNVNQGILSGDVMLVEAYRHVMLDIDLSIMRQVFDEFTKTSVEVCIGQQLDMDFETTENVTLDMYLKMICFKTAVILGFSLKLGGVISHSPKPILNSLYKLGKNLGLAFQLMDDYLDIYGDERLGKAIGGDIKMGKKTYLILKTLEQANREDIIFLNSVLKSSEITQSQIDDTIQIFNKYSIPEQVFELIQEKSNEAVQICDSLKFSDDRKQSLYDIIEMLSNRIN